MKKIGFLGLGVMGLSMALNVSKKIGVEVIGYDVSETQLHRYREMGGTVAASAEELYSTCDVLLQMLPTHAIIQHSVEEAIRVGPAISLWIFPPQHQILFWISIRKQ